MINVGPNNLWARPTCSWGVQRPKPKKVMARAQKYKAKMARRRSRGQSGPRQTQSSIEKRGKKEI